MNVLRNLNMSRRALTDPLPRLLRKNYRLQSTLSAPGLLGAIARHDPTRTAIVHSRSREAFTYGQLCNSVQSAADRLSRSRNVAQGTPVAFMADNSFDYVATLMSILALDAVAVPLATSFPISELRYIVQQSTAPVILATKPHLRKAQDLVDAGSGREIQTIEAESAMDLAKEGSNSALPSSDEGSLMLYTSGTTSRPKGVLLPHRSIAAQVKSLVEAWDYRADDHILHLLPLHHIHGTVNALLAPLFAGSTVEFMFPFNAETVWHRLAAPFLPDAKVPKVTFLTAVPTIWHRLIDSHASLPATDKEASLEAIKPNNLRLNISGSAALPTPTKQAWSKLSSGNVLLERYGMTEVGMALSCGLDFRNRVDGSVGWPLPGVEVRLIDEDTGDVITGENQPGEIQLRGPTIFREYWRNPEVTAREFVNGGDDGKGRWFKTGDVAIRKTVEGTSQSEQKWARGPMYFIQGRKSADIIKTGGEKVSALEIEREMLSLPEISECAVVGVESGAWGQKVGAVVVLSEKGRSGGRGGAAWGPMDMRRALKGRLAGYKIPSEMRVVDTIPRNAMGKINKKMLVGEVFGSRLD